MIVSNVLSEAKQQVLTLGRLGWSQRRIEKQTEVHTAPQVNDTITASKP
jgi:hypothetical protein